jgi:23S rRNA (pseudouridine1915-N3)-methyltransferase
MKISVIAVGRLKAGPEKDLFDTYAKRITWPFEVIEVIEHRKVTGEQLKQREGVLLSSKIPDGAMVIALDERGRELTSRELAGKIEGWQDNAVRDLVFIIGGADGIDGALKQSADLSISLGRMTWPHMLVRTLIAEQVYRAQCIASGHPYHRD